MSRVSSLTSSLPIVRFSPRMRKNRVILEAEFHNFEQKV